MTHANWWERSPFDRRMAHLQACAASIDAEGKEEPELSLRLQAFTLTGTLLRAADSLCAAEETLFAPCPCLTQRLAIRERRNL